jgi:hypothetical protein
MNEQTYYINNIIKIIIISTLDGISIFYLNNYTKKNDNNIPLNDLIHNISKKYFKINKIKLIIKDILCFLPLLYMIYNHPSFICKYIDAYIILRLLKNIFCWITILPVINNKKKINKLSDICCLNIGGNHDLMFSGHITILLIGIISYIKYYNKKIDIKIVLYLFFSSLLVIITKSHYSIDVLTAYFVSYSVLKYKDLV